MASHLDFAPHSNGAWLPLEGELADARYERLTEEVCGEFWFVGDFRRIRTSFVPISSEIVRHLIRLIKFIERFL